MKILAHSVVPVNPVPYLHLGYISAIPYEKTSSSLPGLQVMLAAGWVFIFAGILLLSRHQFRDTLTWRRAWPILPLFGIGMALLIVPPMIHLPQHYIRPRAATMQNIKDMTTTLGQVLKAGDPPPEDAAELVKTYPATSMKLNDGWQHPLRIIARENHGEKGYGITSAGPDGVFVTEDDITGRIITMTEIQCEITKDITAGYGSEIMSRLEKKVAIASTSLPQILDYFDLPDIVNDAWARPLKMTIDKQDGHAVIIIASAGPDGKHGTADDLITTMETEKIILKEEGK